MATPHDLKGTLAELKRLKPRQRAEQACTECQIHHRKCIRERAATRCNRCIQYGTNCTFNKSSEEPSSHSGPVIPQRNEQTSTSRQRPDRPQSPRPTVTSWSPAQDNTMIRPASPSQTRYEGTSRSVHAQDVYRMPPPHENIGHRFSNENSRSPPWPSSSGNQQTFVHFGHSSESGQNSQHMSRHHDQQHMFTNPLPLRIDNTSLPQQRPAIRFTGDGTPEQGAYPAMNATSAARSHRSSLLDELNSPL
ncbi:hypothetical protein BD410DRAFT_32558 [Rickenella mellea]|uniref:Zn(2)-C6 fungal-type domain-containing protein n=1 Tax=Rickenella mellea TaxID=50990 RepID=A0A4R5XFQ7_9AGAM|nr:hypothetical protein BD410DRAFT_32558 [Rickenella mellea]